MDRKELEAAVQRDCVGEGRTHYNTCPCSVLNLLDEYDQLAWEFEDYRIQIRSLASKLLLKIGPPPVC